MAGTGYTPQALGARTRAAVHARGMRPVAGDLARWGTAAVLGAPWVPAGAQHNFSKATVRRCW